MGFRPGGRRVALAKSPWELGRGRAKGEGVGMVRAYKIIFNGKVL